MSTSTPYHARKLRHKRVRRTVSGTSERPRLNVFRSAAHVYAQVVDDSSGRTLAAASDLDPVALAEVKGKPKRERAAVVGKLIAERAREHGVTTVVFDRGGYQYHGRVKALAEAAREAGLEF